MKKFNTLIIAACLLINTSPVFAQFDITGKISNTKGETISGATIRIDNTFSGGQSDSAGVYELKNVKSGVVILHTSFIGYQTRTDTILLTTNKLVDFQLKENTILMDEIIVSSTRVDEKSAMAYSTLSKTQIAEQNLGEDLPYLLNQQPSVVTTSDAGTGIGYTGIRIRGVDNTRVNVTINGVPVNDAESQGTYWVDIPDIASSIDNIQIQRGVGTSTNGAGAFGGSLNIQTTTLNPKAYGELNSTIGSFNTFKYTVNAGTGLIDNKFVMDVRLSKINSDGFVDRGNSDLKSYYLSAAYYGKKDIVKFITFSGLEETYQAWNGIPESRLKGDVQGMNDYIIRNGLDDAEALNILNSSSRTYNQFEYENQVDHYQQNYYQLHFSHAFNSHWNSNIALHYTKGKGYYEEFKKNQTFSSYGLSDIIIGTVTISQTNLVRRRWLDNDFYGATFSMHYDTHKNFSAIVGGAWNQYTGLHYGEIIWAEHSLNNFIHQHYYNDTANKTDFNLFVKGNYLIADQLNFFADMQYRIVNYSFLGFDDSLNNIQQTAKLGFINPKFGLNYEVNPNINVYVSYSIGNKEPSRDDYTQSTPTSRPKHETLNDIEFGYKHKTKRMMWSVNAFYMNYKNQLVLTGEVNDVGAYNRTNVPISYRQGIELEYGVHILNNLHLNANATFSQNRVREFEEYIDNFDSTAQRLIKYDGSDIAFSPNLVMSSTIMYEPAKHFQISFISKYVGKQYLDNTSNDDRKLASFFVNDLRLNYSFQLKNGAEIGYILQVNNLFNEEYESNGYTYGYISGGVHTVENFYYPQAGRNFMFGIRLKL